MTFSVPGTSNPVTTYIDSNQTIANPNPIILDSAGSCTAYGAGTFREIVKDAAGNVISDAVVSTSAIFTPSAAVTLVSLGVSPPLVTLLQSISTAAAAKLLGIDPTLRLSVLDLVATGGNLYVPNGSGLAINDSAGTPHQVVSIGPDNFTNNFNAAAQGWRVLNQAGSLALLTINDAGTSSFVADIICNGLRVNGNLGLNVATNAAITGALSAGSFSSPNVAATNNLTAGSINTNGLAAVGTLTTAGTATFNNVVRINGNIVQTGNSPFLNITFGPGSAIWSELISLICSNGVTGSGFFTTSDARMKTEITDLTVEDAYDWINAGRARKYMLDGRQRAGFIAQEDLATGRGSAVTAVADDAAAFAEAGGDGSPAGYRLSRNYNEDVAYLTRVIQDLVTRVTELESRI